MQNTLAVEASRDALRLKAAYLLNFARFVYWPADKAGMTLHVCIINGDQYDDLVKEFEPGNVQHRNVSLVVLDQDAAVRPDCDLLFISEGHREEWQDILKNLQGRPVLTVGEEEDFIARGGMMRFYHDKGKLRFAANPERARASGVQLSAKLLDLARIESSAVH